jgi:hypothetical protein
MQTDEHLAWQYTQLHDGKGMVADIAGQVARPLPVLWSQWEYAVTEPLLHIDNPHGVQVA